MSAGLSAAQVQDRAELALAGARSSSGTYAAIPRRHRRAVLCATKEPRKRGSVPSARSGTYTGDRGLTTARSP